MILKKMIAGISIVFFLTVTAYAEIYTQTLKIGDDSDTFTQYKENKNKSLYDVEKTSQDIQQATNTIVVPYNTIEYVPTMRYPYTFSTYSTYYYPTTSMGLHFSTRPYYCVKAPCPMPPSRPTRPVRPPYGGSQGGMKIYTNFSGGYSYGGDPKTWSSTSFPSNRPGMGIQPRR